MNMPANATDPDRTGQIRGRHYIVISFSNTGVFKIKDQKHWDKLFRKLIF